ncbi:cobalamin-binding protein [Bacillus sp. T33-2]|uniref:cobalamin-binding protein n=1 Tax=Bacillus sp. T33-2 TaxID=2054168 RepID=UPI000C75E511|nr:cobalamin-binding protein [Bacillus sp. T33-2]PLR92637.1 cobalamin-binding protein [Bacillus sp. T33-2]
MRVISLCPSNTEVLTYLGVAEWLVGVDDYSDWPDSINGLPRLGPDLSIDMDRVEKLKPDLVLASLSVPGMEKNVDALVGRGIPHIVLNPQSLEDIAEDLVLTARALNIQEKGLEAEKLFRSRLASIKQKSLAAGKPPSLYWEWWPKPIFTPGQINWLTEISEAAGARNIFDDVELASVQTDWDDVVSRKPDMICLAWVGVRQDKINIELVKKRPAFEKLGLDDGRIVVLEEELYCRPSPRLLDGLEKLSRLVRSRFHM